MKINLRQAENGGRIIRHFCQLTGAEYELALRDLLADLMHWAVARDFDFDDELRIARDHHAAECLEDQAGGAA